MSENNFSVAHAADGDFTENVSAFPRKLNPEKLSWLPFFIQKHISERFPIGKLITKNHDSFENAENFLRNSTLLAAQCTIKICNHRKSNHSLRYVWNNIQIIFIAVIKMHLMSPEKKKANVCGAWLWVVQIYDVSLTCLLWDQNVSSLSSRELHIELLIVQEK